MRPLVLLVTSLVATAGLAQEPATRILFGDLHVHTTYSPDARLGFGTRIDKDPAHAYRQGREVGLDFMAVTDHDLVMTPRQWRNTCRIADLHDEPGAFTTFIGYEWTSTGFSLGDVRVLREGYGHKNVLYSGSDVPDVVFRSSDPRYDTPEELWAALARWRSGAAGRDVLTIPHSPMSDEGAEVEGMLRVVADQRVDWDRADHRFQTLVEIFSKHGSAEGTDGLPAERVAALARDLHQGDHAARQAALEQLYLPVMSLEWTAAEHSVQSALDRWRPGRDEDYRLGILASSDDHRAAPGSVGERADEDFWLTNGGLVAVHATANDRPSIWRALRARSVYGTSGARIELWFEIEAGGVRVPMGGLVEADEGPTLHLRARGEDGRAIVAFHVIKNGAVVARLEAERDGAVDHVARWTDPEFEGDSWYYVRALQEETATYFKPVFDTEGKHLERYELSERAWSSPIWVVSGAGEDR